MDKTALYSISYGLYVVGVKEGNRDCGCIVDAFMQSTAEPTTVILCSIKANHTNKLIKQTGEFSISVLSKDVDFDIIKTFGLQSARDVNKWENVAHIEKFGLPVLKDACAYIHCKVINSVELSTHTAFICEVLNAEKGEGQPIIYADYLKEKRARAEVSATSKKRYVCSVCGYVYDGDVPFENLPSSFVCPVCKQPKSVFELKNL
ncbi:MAG: flavin reductase [Clostridia bacterium]